METAVHQILEHYPLYERGNLIPILQAVQKEEGYIFPEAVDEISRHLRISKNQVYGVATFYSQFKFNPPGRHPIKICLGTACHVRGGDFLLKALQMEIGITPGQTTADQKFELERVACLGCCALAPVMMIAKDTHSRMSVIQIKEKLSRYE